MIETIIDGAPYYAAMSLIGDKGAFVLSAASMEQIDKLWRDELTLNVTLFAGISSILLVILYAYYIQAKRARDADEIFARIQSARRNGAVARPLRSLGFRLRQPRLLLVAVDVRYARHAGCRSACCRSAMPHG